MPAMRALFLIMLLGLSGCTDPDAVNGRASSHGPDHVSIGFPF
jgi:hypothetical protein